VVPTCVSFPVTVWSLFLLYFKSSFAFFSDGADVIASLGSFLSDWTSLASKFVFLAVFWIVFFLPRAFIYLPAPNFREDGAWCGTYLLYRLASFVPQWVWLFGDSGWIFY